VSWRTWYARNCKTARGQWFHNISSQLFDVRDLKIGQCDSEC